MNHQTIEELFTKIKPFPISFNVEDIKNRKKELDHIQQYLNHLQQRLKAERNYMQAQCKHENCFSSNWCGRDPGGGGCNTCGKQW